MKETRIHSFWAFWLPALAILLQLCIESTLDGQTLSVMHSENGPHEILQTLVITMAFLFAVSALARLDKRERPGFAAWLGLAAVCCFYVAGEEISWGQHIFDWGTPEYWLERNDQAETNLHNTSSWLDQKPRLILLLGVVTGGLVFPLLQKIKPGLLPDRFAAVYPPARLAFVAFLALAVKLAEKTGEAFDVTLFARASEVEELFLFYFVLLYLAVLRSRTKPHAGIAAKPAQ